MRITLAQIDTTVADFRGNRERILSAWRAAAERGDDLVVAPELSVAGYPPLDLLVRDDFVDAAEASLREIAAEVRDGPALIVGSVRRVPGHRGLRNTAAWVADGEILGHHDKQRLPTYDIFDEGRYFDAGPAATVWEIAGRRVGVAICEDLWDPEGRLYDVDPVAELVAAGVDLVVSPSASPFHRGKRAFRRRLFTTQARRLGVPVVVCNLVGGNTELIFDGTSLRADPDGTIEEYASFEECSIVVDLAEPARATPPPEDPDEAVADALVLGIRDYFRKCGLDRAWIGLSGGIDSALVCALATEALGAGAVHGVALPSRYSSEGSLADARALAEALGIEFSTIPIEPAHAGLARAIEEGMGAAPTGLADENLQARIRGTILMTLSNQHGGAVLATGNKSEIATGYNTLYGDLCGALTPIGDLTKDLVGLVARLPRFGGRIPVSTLEKPPSAELRPDQLDTDSLPPYDALDPVVVGWVEADRGVAALREEGHDPALVGEVARLVETSEYKRAQTAPILRVTPRAFGVGRRVPIARGRTEV